MTRAGADLPLQQVPNQSSPLLRLCVAGLALLAVGLGCGQFTAVTTVERDENGGHNGTWTVDLALDDQVFAELQALSSEPIDLDYRASMLSEAGWEGTARTSGISARRSFVVPDELNADDNPLVMLFAGDEGQPPEENLVRWTELEIDETDPDRVTYKYSAEVYVPHVDTDEVLDQIVLSLSAGRADAIGSTETERLNEAIVAAGPFVVQMDVNLPGEVNPDSIRGYGSHLGAGSVSWRLDRNGSYLLEAVSTLELGATAVPAKQTGESAAEEPTDGDSTPGASAKGGAGSGLTQKGAALLLGALGAYIAYQGAKGIVVVSSTVLSPGIMVIGGAVAIAGAVYVWNYGPPDLPPSPVSVFVEAARNNVKALERSSLRGLTVEEARELGFELEKLSPAQKRAVSKELGVPYQALHEALMDAKEHPEFFK